MRKLIVIIGLAVAMASTAACSGENAKLTLYSPESIEADGFGEFTAIMDGATPLLGLVYWYPSSTWTATSTRTGMSTSDRRPTTAALIG